jgi:hypothetical protein
MPSWHVDRTAAVATAIAVVVLLTLWQLAASAGAFGATDDATTVARAHAVEPVRDASSSIAADTPVERQRLVKMSERVTAPCARASSSASGHSDATAVRVLTFNPLSGWYGLTNQLLSYAAALRFALAENRSVLFPDHPASDGLVPFHELFNATLTLDVLRRTVARAVAASSPPMDAETLRWAWRSGRAFPSAAYPALAVAQAGGLVAVPAAAQPTSMNKRNMHLPNRDSYRGAPDSPAVRGARVYVARLHEKARAFNFTRHHNFFMRMPWAAEAAAPAVLQEAHFVTALQPVDAIDHAWLALARAMSVAGAAVGASEPLCSSPLACARWTRLHVVALHLRLESDAALLLRALPSAADLVTFLESHADAILGGALRGGASVLYICIGDWPSEAFEREVERFAVRFEASRGVRVWWRRRLERAAAAASSPPLYELPRAQGFQRQLHQRERGVRSTQDHFLSFVDLLFLVRARRAVVSAHSSLKFAVFAHRCYNPMTDDVHVRDALRCALPAHRLVHWDESGGGGSGDADELALLELDPTTGRPVAVRALRCADRAAGWAGHVSWA